MINNINYISIKEVLSRLLRHPLLQKVDLESAIQYTIDFISRVSMVDFYLKKECEIKIEDYRGLLPCDVISIDQVKMKKNNIYLRSMTSTFLGEDSKSKDYTFKTQGRVIFTSFKNGEIKVAYKAIPTDDEGLPLIPDNPIFLKTLELYIKKEVFTILYETGEMNRQIYDNALGEYYANTALLESEFNTPSVSEMESISNMLHQMINRSSDYQDGFRNAGAREIYRIHNHD